MARKLRIEYAGAIYHVSVRMVGNWKRDRTWLFEDDADRDRFLEQLSERVETFNVRLYMFCLMSNHFHLLVETPGGNLSRFMQSLATAYTVYFNLRHGRHGHLMDGRYKSKLVDGDEYLLSLSRYVHLNPVYVGGWQEQPLEERLDHLRRYRWSTYRSYAGFTKKLDYVKYGPLLGMAGGKGRDQNKRYREFVETGLAETDKEFLEILKESPTSIGGEAFRAWVGQLYEGLMEGRKRPEDVVLRGVVEPLSPGEVLGAISLALKVKEECLKLRSRDSRLRALAGRCLIRHAGLMQREVAELLGLGTGAAVSRQQKQLAAELSSDRRLRKQQEEIEKAIATLKQAKIKPAMGGKA